MGKITYRKIKITDENRDNYNDYRERYERLGTVGLLYVPIPNNMDFRLCVRLSDEYIHDFGTFHWPTIVEFEEGIKKQTNLTDDWVEAFAQALAI